MKDYPKECLNVYKSLVHGYYKPTHRSVFTTVKNKVLIATCIWCLETRSSNCPAKGRRVPHTKKTVLPRMPIAPLLRNTGSDHVLKPDFISSSLSQLLWM